MALKDIAFVGDIHGSMNYLVNAMENSARVGIDTIIQVGDFWTYGDNELIKINRVVDRIKDQFGVDMTVHFIDGNHEDYRIIDPRGNTRHFIEDRLIYHPRGDVFTVHDVVIGCYGGAVSIDQELRYEGRDWWRQEKPNDSDLDKAVHAFQDHDLDVLVTHDIPDFAIDQVYRGRTPNLYDSAEVRHDIDTLVAVSNVPVVVHGHWHTPSVDTYEDVTVVSLNRDTRPGHVAVIDGSLVQAVTDYGYDYFPIADL